MNYTEGQRLGKLVFTGEIEFRGRLLYLKFQCDCGKLRWLYHYEAKHYDDCGCTRRALSEGKRLARERRKYDRRSLKRYKRIIADYQEKVKILEEKLQRENSV